MTKKQKVTVAIMGPIVFALTLALLFVWPWLTIRDVSSPKAASGQTSTGIVGAIASSAVGQAGGTNVLTNFVEPIPAAYQLHCLPTLVNCSAELTANGNPTFDSRRFPGAPSILISDKNSIINNATGSYIHFADDLRLDGSSGAGCVPCGSSGTAGASDSLPSLFLQRQHRMIDLGPISSFGRGVFSNYDLKILVDAAQGAEVFDPAALDSRILWPQGNGRYTDNIKTIKELQVLDAQGNPTADLAQAKTAHV